MNITLDEFNDEIQKARNEARNEERLIWNKKIDEIQAKLSYNFLVKNAKSDTERREIQRIVSSLGGYSLTCADELQQLCHIQMIGSDCRNEVIKEALKDYINKLTELFPLHK